MDILEGLLGGLFHMHVCYPEERKYRYKLFKKYVDEGKLIRDIQDAPRDSRYKIDYYYSSIYPLDSMTDNYRSHSFDCVYLNGIINTLNYLGITSSFQPLSLTDTELKLKDFTISRVDKNVLATQEGVKMRHSYNSKVYYLKYKGKTDYKIFNPSFDGRLTDSDFIIELHKGEPTYFDSFSDLLYQLRHYLAYYKLTNVNGVRVSPF